MIVLHRNREDGKGLQIQAALEDLVVAHRVEVVSSAAEASAAVATLPAIVDNGRTIVGDSALDAYLDELAAWMGEWRKFQSDSCYIDDDGEVC